MCFERVICAVVSSAFLPKARSSLCVGPTLAVTHYFVHLPRIMPLYIVYYVDIRR